MNSETHLVLIPSYNTGAALLPTVEEACQHWAPVWVVIDGSTDGSDNSLNRLDLGESQLHVLRLPRNGGKGTAVQAGIEAAQQHGFTHVLVMDADGQHPADRIADFMAASAAAPNAMILGVPLFGPDAPWPRVLFRRLCNYLVQFETGHMPVGDSLFGFRIYPVAPLRHIMASTRWMRGFDFDPEAVVRLCWRGVHTINIPATVRYFRRDQNGVSHFRYLRDNLLLGWMHTRLLLTLAARRLPIGAPPR